MEISLDEIEAKEEIKAKYEQGSLSLADFVHDQLRNIKVNLKKVWKFYNEPTMPEKDLNKVLTWFKKCNPSNPYSQYCKLLNKISTTSKGQKIKNISQVKQEIKSIIENKIKPDIKHKINGRSRHPIKPKKFFGRSRAFVVDVQKKNLR